MRTFVKPLATMIVLSLPATAAAQTVGAEAGLTLGSLSSYQTSDVNEAFSTSLRAGATALFFVDVPVTRHVNLQPGVGFVEKGAKLLAGVPSDTIGIAKLSYLEFPILLRFEAARDGVRPFGFVGPSFGINLSAHVDASASRGPANVDVGNQVRTADLGIALGGGIAKDRWLVEGRLTQGVIDIGETPRVDTIVRTRTISFLAGIRF
jgi:outer membrane protein with beta-barrel domain